MIFFKKKDNKLLFKVTRLNQLEKHEGVWEKLIECLARLWANLLPSLLVWEKLNHLKELKKKLKKKKNLACSIKFPKIDQYGASFASACMTISESPSNTSWLIPISKAISKALAASTANRSWWICWAMNAIISPLESWVTM